MKIEAVIIQGEMKEAPIWGRSRRQSEPARARPIRELCSIRAPDLAYLDIASDPDRPEKDPVRRPSELGHQRTGGKAWLMGLSRGHIPNDDPPPTLALGKPCNPCTIL
jgi:hypothetical protein